MCEMIFAVAFMSLASAFLILFIGKTGIRDRIIERSRFRIVSEMFGCDFCLGFWTSAVFAVFVTAVTGSAVFLSVPVFSAPVIRKLIS